MGSVPHEFTVIAPLFPQPRRYETKEFIHYSFSRHTPVASADYKISEIFPAFTSQKRGAK